MKRLVVALLGLAVAACTAVVPNPSATTSPTPPSWRPNLGVANGTTLAVTLVVNGQSVAVFPPSGPEPSIDLTALPPLPWSVQALSPSGRLLTSMQVEPGGTVVLDTSGAVYSGQQSLVDPRLDEIGKAPWGRPRAARPSRTTFGRYARHPVG